MDQMKNDIIQVISKYLDIDTDELDIKMAKDDVSRFIYDQRELELWSKEFFKAIASMIKFNPDYAIEKVHS